MRLLLYLPAVNFAVYLENAIKAAGFKKNQFADAVGTSPSVITDQTKDRRPPPLDQLDNWAKALRLDSDQRRMFKMLAGIRHIKDLAVREIVSEEITLLRAEVAALSKRVRR